MSIPIGIVDSNIKISGKDLVFYLDASQTRSYPGSGTAWTDLTGNGRNVTLVNGPTYSSGNGGAIVFDGTNDYGTFGGGALNGTSSFTVSAWVKMPASNNNGRILSFDSSGCNGWVFSTSSIGNQDATCVGATARFFYFPDASNFINTVGGAWYNFTGVYDTAAGKTTAFRNGVQAEQVNNAGTGAAGTATIWMAARDVPDSYYDLTISQVQRWNRAFTATEVSALFDAYKSRYGTLYIP